MQYHCILGHYGDDRNMILVTFQNEENAREALRILQETKPEHIKCAYSLDTIYYSSDKEEMESIKRMRGVWKDTMRAKHYSGAPTTFSMKEETE